jgi:hypothetical protein
MADFSPLCKTCGEIDLREWALEALSIETTNRRRQYEDEPMNLAAMAPPLREGLISVLHTPLAASKISGLDLYGCLR